MDAWLADMTYWHWLFLGLAALIIELLSGSGFLLAIAIAAALTSIYVAVFLSIAWTGQAYIFSLLALVACFAWGVYLRSRKMNIATPALNQRAAQYIGKIVTLKESMQDGRGKLILHDTVWVIEGETLAAGSRVKIIAAVGTVLKIEAVQS